MSDTSPEAELVQLRLLARIMVRAIKDAVAVHAGCLITNQDATDIHRVLRHLRVWKELRDVDDDGADTDPVDDG